MLVLITSLITFLKILKVHLSCKGMNGLLFNDFIFFNNTAMEIYPDNYRNFWIWFSQHFLGRYSSFVKMLIKIGTKRKSLTLYDVSYFLITAIYTPSIQFLEDIKRNKKVEINNRSNSGIKIVHLGCLTWFWMRLWFFGASLLKMSLFHRCFSNILPVKGNYQVST